MGVISPTCYGLPPISSDDPELTLPQAPPEKMPKESLLPLGGKGGESSKEELHPPLAHQAAKNREGPSATTSPPSPIWPDDLWSHARWCQWWLDDPDL